MNVGIDQLREDNVDLHDGGENINIKTRMNDSFDNTTDLLEIFGDLFACVPTAVDVEIPLPPEMEQDVGANRGCDLGIPRVDEKSSVLSLGSDRSELSALE